MKSIGRDIFAILCAVIIVLGVSVYGGHPSLSASVQGAVALVRDTLAGKHLVENYWGVTGYEVVNSLQLIGLAFIMAIFLGALFVLFSVTAKRRVSRALLDGVVTVLESVPDAMYVVISVALFLVLLENFQIALPLFGGNFYPTFTETLIPALSLALPASLQIRRLVTERLEEEMEAHYVVTALSKGSSFRRAFYRHILPNAGATFLRSIAVAVSILLASLLFCTYFFQYHDLSFKFAQAIGWDQSTGYRLTGHFMGYIPAYQPGTIALIGLLLVVFWAVARLLTELLSRRWFPADRDVTSAFIWQPMRKFWIVLGSVILLVLLFFGTFPQLLTAHGPTQILLGRPDQSWPLFPSKSTPMGTDGVGHDLFSIMLHGTWSTLLTTIGIAILVTVGSFAIALLGVVTDNRGKQRWPSTVLRTANSILSALPGFFVLFLILYPRNQAIVSAYTSHKASIPIWRQDVVFVFWLCVLEMGRGSYVFYETLTEWGRFSFMEGVHSIGRSDFSALVTSLRPWLTRFGLSFIFGEMSRILSIMTQLAAFSLFLAAKIGWLQFTFSPVPVHGLVAAQSNWVSVLGGIMNQYAFISYPFVLYGPLIFILLAMLASNFVSRGIRGGP